MDIQSMTRPHRLKWFQDNIGKYIKRRDFITYKYIDIYVDDNKKANLLFYTQFDIGLRYMRK